MALLSQLLPDPEALLQLEPEELAAFLLEHLNSLPPSERRLLNHHNFTQKETFRSYAPHLQERVAQAVTEAWWWLEREGLIVTGAGHEPGWCVISRRGEKLAKAADVRAYRHSSLLPTSQLHSRLQSEVVAMFLRADYDTAVFRAFKEVEVAVREAGGYDSTQIGVTLMRRAFHPENGPLRDAAAPDAERQGVSDLFAGAIAVFKNPHSHRNVALDDPREAVEMVMLASHLLRIVDARISQLKSDSGAV